MSIPDFEAIGRALDTAEPIQMNIMPYRAFCLASLLQLSLRHPRLKLDTPALAEVAESMVQNLTARLGEVDPAIAAALETGSNRAMDMTREEYELYQQGEFEPGSNCSFVQLRPELKAEILTLSQTLMLACQLISQNSNDSVEEWTSELRRRAVYIIDDLTSEQVDEAIEALEDEGTGTIINISLGESHE